MRRALASRDRGCRFSGCTATYRLHGYHAKHWAGGGEISLDNLILLCPTHHRLVHEGGFDVQRLDDGAFRFTNRYGVAVRPPKRAEMSSPDTIAIQNDSLGLAIDRETATAHWHGERIDYDHALMVAMASWDSGDTRPEAGPTAGTGIHRRGGSPSSRRIHPMPRVGMIEAAVVDGDLRSCRRRSFRRRGARCDLPLKALTDLDEAPDTETVPHDMTALGVCLDW